MSTSRCIFERHVKLLTSSQTRSLTTTVIPAVVAWLGSARTSGRKKQDAGCICGTAARCARRTVRDARSPDAEKYGPFTPSYLLVRPTRNVRGHRGTSDATTLNREFPRIQFVSSKVETLPKSCSRSPKTEPKRNQSRVEPRRYSSQCQKLSTDSLSSATRRARLGRWSLLGWNAQPQPHPQPHPQRS